MDIRIRGAREHNLKNIDIEFGGGLTVVTGVSGSGKTSLVFDTLYHEARRRFLDVYLYGRGGQRLAPARVEQITGLGPTIAVGQNLLNRNPNSILATAAGLHPFLRLLYTNFGERHCIHCGEPVSLLSEDEIIERLVKLSNQELLRLYVPLVREIPGSHQTLISVLVDEFDVDRIIVDGKSLDSDPLDSRQPHSIEIEIGSLGGTEPVNEVREIVQRAASLGAGAIRARGVSVEQTLATSMICTRCGSGLGELRATHFNQKCPYCKGEGCQRCDGTGMHPQAASVTWEGMRLPDFLSNSIDEALTTFSDAILPSSAERLRSEISRRLEALERVGLGYLGLNRSSPTLSRGESQRVRLAISLSSRLEDMLHVLDEPTIGQHPADVARFLPAFRDLAGPVIYVEHDRLAAAAADHAVDLGPGAGVEGGKVVCKGSPLELWHSDTATGRYFSSRQRVMIPDPRPSPKEYIRIGGAWKHNLQRVDVRIPIGCSTVLTGVSGSGKSTLVEHVLIGDGRSIPDRSQSKI
jgi:excinuclease ABC subunit A